MLLIDAIATRYHCLPSEFLSKGDTFDVFVINVILEHQQYMAEAERAKQEGRPPPPKKLTQDEMRAMIERVRSRNGNKKSQ